MVHFIDKDAVVAKIEKLISNGQTKLKESEECKDYESYVAWAEHIATCIKVLSFINTLEVKEVDLDGERRKYLTEHFNVYEDGILQSKRSNLPLETYDVIKIAKHFFELGMAVNNPITEADRCMAEGIIIHLKDIENNYLIDLTKEIEWVRNQVKKGE